MDKMEHLYELIEAFKSQLARTPPKNRTATIEKAIKSLKSWTKSLRPSQTQLKKELLTNPTAIRIRQIYGDHKKSINLRLFGEELGLTVKTPTLDHILIGYYYPLDRLHDLTTRFEALANADPATQARKKFQDWRSELKSCGSKDSIADELDRLITDHGLEAVREFAAYLKTKSSTGRGKLGRRASRANVVKAVAAHLWNEKMTTRAQEGYHEGN
jgi:hypothetical protein